jgi:hypothetical protein
VKGILILSKYTVKTLKIHLHEHDDDDYDDDDGLSK